MGCLVLGTALPSGGLLAADVESARWVITDDAETPAVEAAHFAIRWSAAAGGDIVSIVVDDGTNHQLFRPTAVRAGFPGWRVVDQAGDWRPRGQASFQWLERREDSAVLESTCQLTGLDGAPGPWALRQTFTIEPAGIIRVAMELTLATGTTALVERATVGLPLALDTFARKRWYWARDARHTEHFKDFGHAQALGPAAYVGAALGHNDGFGAWVQLAIGDQRPLVGTTPAVLSSARDGYWVYRLKAPGTPSVECQGPTTYQNELVLFLDTQPRASAWYGARPVWWQGNVRSGMPVPTQLALAAMADVGVDALILNSGWRQPGAVPPKAAAPETLARLAGEAARFGIDLLATVPVAGEPNAVARAVTALGFDGVVVEDASPLWRARSHPGGQAFPHADTYTWLRDLRRALPPGARLAAEAGVGGVDLAITTAVDGWVFGRQPGARSELRSPTRAAYFAAEGAAVGCGLITDPELEGPGLLASLAATGGTPVVPLGLGQRRSAYRGARWAGPLWNLYRLLPRSQPIRQLGPNALRSENPAMAARAFTVADSAWLAVAANLSTAPRDSTTLEFDATNLAGGRPLAIEEARQWDNSTFETIYLGESSDGRIDTEPLERYALRGFVAVAGDTPRSLARRLDLANRFGELLRGGPPPTPPTDVGATTESGAVRIHWRPTIGRGIDSYRVFKSPTERFGTDTLVDLGRVWQDTTLIDTSLGPGQATYYAVVAVDLDDQESRPSTPVFLERRRALTTVDFADSTARWQTISGTWRRVAERLVGTQERSTEPAIALGAEAPGGFWTVEATLSGLALYGGGVVIGADREGTEALLVHLAGDAAREVLEIARWHDEQLEQLAQKPWWYRAIGSEESRQHVLSCTYTGGTLRVAVDGTEALSLPVVLNHRWAGVAATRGSPQFGRLAILAPRS